MRFKKLPLRLMQRWWEWTCYGKHPATNELMWTIEAFDPELAEHLARGDAERTEKTWGETEQIKNSCEAGSAAGRSPVNSRNDQRDQKESRQ
jgi:hypothetical protein